MYSTWTDNSIIIDPNTRVVPENTHTHTHTYTHTHTHARTHACTHTHTHIGKGYTQPRFHAELPHSEFHKRMFSTHSFTMFTNTLACVTVDE